MAPEFNHHNHNHNGSQNCHFDEMDDALNDDALMNHFIIGSDDDMSLGSIDSTESASPTCAVAQKRLIPVLPKENDVCFKSCKHPGTIRWREVVKSFSARKDEFPNWNETVFVEIQSTLSQEKITRFLINLDSDGHPSTKIKEGHWYLAFPQEISERTKQRFAEYRKERSKLTSNRGVGRPPRNAVPPSSNNGLTQQHQQQYHHQVNAHDLQPIPYHNYHQSASNNLMTNLQRSLAALLDPRLELDGVLEGQDAQFLLSIHLGLEKLQKSISSEFLKRQQRYILQHSNTYQASFHQVSATPPLPSDRPLISNPFEERVRNATGYAAPCPPQSMLALATPEACKSDYDINRLRLAAPEPCTDNTGMIMKNRHNASINMDASHASRQDSALIQPQVVSSGAVDGKNACLLAAEDDDGARRHETFRRLSSRSDNVVAQSVTVQTTFEFHRLETRQSIAIAPPPQEVQESVPKNIEAVVMPARVEQSQSLVPDPIGTVPADLPLSTEVPISLNNEVPDMPSSISSIEQLQANMGQVAICLHDEKNQGGGKAAWIAGRPLTGTISVSVRDTKVEDGRVRIHILGKEEIVDGILLKSDIFDESFVVLDLSRNALSPGNNEIPFSIPLPESLPTSMTIEFQGHTLARISYEIQVDYEVRGELVPKSGVLPFSVQACPLPSDLTPLFWGPKPHKVRSMKVFRKGLLSLGVKLHTSKIGRGETLEISLACRNRSSVEIKQVKVKLLEQIQWFEVEGRTDTIVLCDIDNLDLPGLARRGAGKSNNIFADDNNSETLDHSEILQELESEVNKFCLTIPEDSRDTYQGKMFAISHFLKIKLVTSFATENFSEMIPLTIGVPPLTRPIPDKSMNQEQKGRQLHSKEQQQQNGQEENLQEGHEQHSMSTISADSGLGAGPFNARREGTRMVSNRKGASMPARQLAPANAASSRLSRGSTDNRRGGEARATASATVHSIVTPTTGTQATTTATTKTAAPKSAALIRFLAQVDTLGDDSSNSFSQILAEETWKEFVASLNADDFGSIVKHVSSDSDRLHVAEMVALRIRIFTCQHAANAMQATSFRVSMAKRLMPLCSDANVHQNVVTDQLEDEWDKKLALEMTERLRIS